MLPLFDRPVLAIESSCDETSAAVLVGRSVRSNVVASQIDMHLKWGGVVPEAAARAHVEAILPVVSEALETGGVSLQEIGGICVTNRPGLIGALAVGLTCAKGLAWSLGVPLLGVHHLEGHLLSVLADPLPNPKFPMLSLIASGGHTELVLVSGLGEYRIVAETRDDAAGEAFDKGARLLGLGYPGGRAIQELALSGHPRYPLPRGVAKDPNSFSFSGLKTAMLRLVEREGADLNRADAAASLQEAVVDSLARKTMAAADELGVQSVALVGGVAANVALRDRLEASCRKSSLQFLVPPFELCTDNAAMIGLAGSWRLAKGECDSFDLDAMPNSSLTPVDFAS